MKETMCVYITNRTPARPAQAAWMGRVVGARELQAPGKGGRRPRRPRPGARGCSPNAACAVAPPLCACFLPRPQSGGGACPLFKPVTPSHLSVQTSCPAAARLLRSEEAAQDPPPKPLTGSEPCAEPRAAADPPLSAARRPAHFHPS